MRGWCCVLAKPAGGMKVSNYLKTAQNLKIAATVVGIKLLVVFFGIQTYLVATDRPIHSIYRILYIWKKWDAIHYIKIAQNGYVSAGDDRLLLVFYPLYPLLVAIFDFVLSDTVLSAFVVSGIATVVLAIVLRELVRLDYPERVAQSAVIFLFIFPTSFVLHIPYTESLFLALAVSAFFAARKRRWVIAGILGCLACTTRVNGLVLFPALMFEILAEYRETKKLNAAWAWLLCIPFGVGLYLFLNYYVSGNPFQFLIYQREHWHKSLELPWEGLVTSVRILVGQNPSKALMLGFQEICFVAIGLTGIACGLRRLRASYNVWMITNWLMFVSSSYVLGVARYTIVMFPLFIVIALVSQRSRLFKTIATVWSVLFLAFFVSEFVRGNWTF